MIFIYEDEEKINTFNNFNFYKQTKFNKTYNLLNDVYDIKLVNEDVIFSLEIIKNETIKINELIIPIEITKYLKDRNWLKVFFSVYWYFCLIINLPFIFTYLTLMNNFSGLWLICETMMILVTIILMPNFITFIVVFSFYGNFLTI